MTQTTSPAPWSAKDVCQYSSPTRFPNVKVYADAFYGMGVIMTIVAANSRHGIG